MNMKCRNLSELKCFERIRLIAGEGGLDRIITWVYINQDVSICGWIHGGELVFITGMEDGFSDKALVSIVCECIENAASGIVILLNPEHIGSVPKEVISIAEREDMPLYEMPWELKLVDVTREIADTIIINQLNERRVMGFFSELLFTRHISAASVRNMGIHCGVDTEADAAMMIIRPVCTENCSRTDLDNIFSALSRAVDNCLYSQRISFVSYIYMDEIFVYIVCTSSGVLPKIRCVLTETCIDFSSKRGDIRIHGGIGRITSGIENFRKSYSEARQALELAENENSAVQITLFSELGIIRLLTSPDNRSELKDYCYSTLMPIIDSDRLHNTEYVKTLEAYLRSNCNLVKAAESLFIHRNTMVYRIEKIRTLLEMDFNDMMAKSDCMNALRIMKHFGFGIDDFN